MAQQWHPFQTMFRPALPPLRPRVIKVNQAA